MKQGVPQPQECWDSRAELWSKQQAALPLSGHPRAMASPPTLFSQL